MIFPPDLPEILSRIPMRMLFLGCYFYVPIFLNVPFKRRSLSLMFLLTSFSVPNVP